jgi:7-cyano-7-deazaguanine synthase
MAEAALLLASGGLDSTTLAFHLLDQGTVDITPLFVNYGHHCAATELSTAQAVLPKQLVNRLAVLDVSGIYLGSSSRLIREPNLWSDSVSHDDLYLPYRNLMLITVAAAYAQAHGRSVVYAAFINSNHALELDCSAKFFSELHGLLSNYGSVEIKMPFKEMTKTEVARRALALNVPIGITFSCQAQSEVPCGACPNCVDRLDALRAVADER